MEEKVDHGKTRMTYNPIANLVTLLCVLLVVIVFAWLGLSNQKTDYYAWLIPVLLIITTIGQGFAAPAIPWTQLGLLSLIIFVIHLVIELIHFAPLFFLADYLIEGICVYLFGRSWVKKGYIPHKANHWH